MSLKSKDTKYRCVICGYEQDNDDYCQKCKENNYPIVRRSFMRRIQEQTKEDIFKEKLNDFSESVSDFFQYEGDDTDIEGILESRIERLEDELIEMYQKSIRKKGMLK